MTINKLTQSALILALSAGLGLASVADAGSLQQTNTSTKGVLYAAAAGTVNCGRHATDLCIVNHSDQPVYFTVYNLNQSGQLPPPEWADVYANYYVSSLYVEIDNQNGYPIFRPRYFPNHSIIKITDNVSGKTSNSLKFTITR